MEEVKKIHPSSAFTLVVPLDREVDGKKAIFHIKDIDENVFMAAKTLIDLNKQFDAVRLIVKALWVAGDDVSLLANNFIAVTAATKQVLKLIEPMEGELKKN
jgi:hypothetical protein